MINSFRGDYFFLSNFYPASIIYDNMLFLNNEAAFQAGKVTDIETKRSFQSTSPSKAKSMGRCVQLRPDWEDVKYDIMYKICLAKFTQHNDLADKLLATGNKYLQEENSWGDKVWGTVNGEGQNMLGKILMRVRDELRVKNKKCRMSTIIINPSTEPYELKVENREIESYCFREVGSLFEVKPFDNKYENKSYLGIYLGELPVLIVSQFYENSRTLKNSSFDNPAFFVPKLKRIIYGYECNWNIIRKINDSKIMSCEDIQSTWYIKLLKELSEEQPNG